MLTMIQLEAIRYALVNGQRVDNELVAALFEAYFQALEEALKLHWEAITKKTMMKCMKKPELA